MKRAKIRKVLSSVGAIAGQLVYASEAKKWLESHRAELLALLERGAAVEAAMLVNDFCTAFPPLAAIVTHAMGGTPEQAIASIAFFDTALGDELRRCRENFYQAQIAWQGLRSEPPAQAG